MSNLAINSQSICSLIGTPMDWKSSLSSQRSSSDYLKDSKEMRNYCWWHLLNAFTIISNFLPPVLSESMVSKRWVMISSIFSSVPLLMEFMSNNRLTRLSNSTQAIIKPRVNRSNSLCSSPSQRVGPRLRRTDFGSWSAGKKIESMVVRVTSQRVVYKHYIRRQNSYSYLIVLTRKTYVIHRHSLYVNKLMAQSSKTHFAALPSLSIPTSLGSNID